MVAATFTLAAVTLAAVTLRVTVAGSTPTRAARRSLKSAASKVSTVPANVTTRSTSVSDAPPGVSGGGGLGDGGDGDGGLGGGGLGGGGLGDGGDGGGDDGGGSCGLGAGLTATVRKGVNEKPRAA